MEPAPPPETSYLAGATQTFFVKKKIVANRIRQLPYYCNLKIMSVCPERYGTITARAKRSKKIRLRNFKSPGAD